MSASINSVQTRRMAQHFPIRAGQPDIQFTALFRSIDDKHDFQNFVREHQRNALDDGYGSETTSNGAVTLLWPERDIVNWTGYIVSMPVQEIRFVYAPAVTFGIALIDSMLSRRTFNASLGSDYWSIVGNTLGPYISDTAEALIPDPSRSPSSAIAQALDRSYEAVVSYLYGTRPGQ